METKHYTMGCLVKVVLEMFCLEVEILTFCPFFSRIVVLNSKALTHSFVFGTEDRSLKASIYIFIGLQIFLQVKQSSGWSVVREDLA